MHAQRVGPEGGDKEAKLHDLGVQPTSPKRNFGCAADGEHVLTGARAGNWRACTCSPLTAALRSTRRCTVPLVRPPAPPPSATRSPPLFSAAPAFSRRLCALLVAARQLPGGYEADSRAAWSLTTATLAASAARQRGSYLWAARAARARSPAALRAVPGRPTAHALRFAGSGKNVRM